LKLLKRLNLKRLKLLLSKVILGSSKTVVVH